MTQTQRSKKPKILRIQARCYEQPGYAYPVLPHIVLAFACSQHRKVTEEDGKALSDRELLFEFNFLPDTNCSVAMTTVFLPTAISQSQKPSSKLSADFKLNHRNSLMFSHL